MLSQIPLPGLAKRRFGIVKDFGQFIISFAKHLGQRLFSLTKLSFVGIKYPFLFAQNFKFYLTRRLIWGRGRLGRPISHIAIISLTSWVFLMGGSLSGTSVVRSETVRGDILSSTATILPSNIGGEIVPSSSLSSEPINYTVQEGDSLSSIGQKFGISSDTIRFANDIKDNDLLAIGSELTILPVDGLKHKVEADDTVESLAKKYQASAQAIVDFNYLDEPYTLAVGQEVIVPGGTMPAPKPVPQPYSVPYAYGYQPQALTTPAGTGQFRWPCDSYIITQYFSYYHPAVDISPYSTLYAADAGTVVRAGWWPQGYGNAVQIDHGNGYTTTYAHMSEIHVSVGGQVSKGQVIGLMGNTGRSFGTHLHFVVQYFGQYVNPLSFF